MNRISSARARRLAPALALMGLLGVGVAGAQLTQQNRVEAQSIIVVGQPTWFERADLDGDGLLTYNEFRRAAFNWFVDVDAGGDDVISVGEYEQAARNDNVPARDIAGRRTSFFNAADADRNRNVGYYEFARYVRSRFKALDVQRDGKVGPIDLRDAGSSFTEVISPLQRR